MAAAQIEARGRNQILLVLFFGVLMAALDIAIVGPALPAIRATFAVGEQQLAWVFAIYVLLNLIGTPLMARLSDMFGRRIVYTFDLALFAGGSLLVAVAPDFTWLLIGRAVQGLGAGGIFPVASAVIGDTFPPEKRGSALGMIGAVFGIAFLVGPIIGGIILSVASWHWLFLINVPIGILVIAAGWRLLPGTRVAAPSTFDWPGMLVLAGMLASFAYALTRVGHEMQQAGNSGLLPSLLSINTWPFLVLAAVLLPIFIVLEQRTSAPILKLSLFRNRQVALVAAFSFGAGLSEAVTLFIPSLLVTAFQVTPSVATFMLIPMVLGMAVGSPISGRLLDTAGSKIVVILGAGLIAGGLLLESLFSANLIMYYVFSILFGLGMGILLGASLRYILLHEVPPAERTAAQGVLTIFISIGQLLGAALMGGIAAMNQGGTGGYIAAFAAAGVLMLVLMAAAFGLKGRTEELETMRRNEGTAQALS